MRTKVIVLHTVSLLNELRTSYRIGMACQADGRGRWVRGIS